MTRPLRISYPGAIYHIINRGSRRERIFRRRNDRLEFLSKIQSACEKYNAMVHAYCLMDNHYHLLIETLEGDISSIMQKFNRDMPTGFVQNTNRSDLFSRGDTSLCWLKTMPILLP